MDMALMVHCLVTYLLFGSIEARTITVLNNCPYNVWIQNLNLDGPVLPDGVVNLGLWSSHVYYIPNMKWGGRFWPKTGCDDSGNNCETGQSMEPCGPNGCEPPADTKMEFFVPDLATAGSSWYDISLVDGYSISVNVTPTSGIGGSCVETVCNIQLDSCPTNENLVGDLRVIKNNRTVQCLSPCKKWNYPPPFGMGKSEQEQTGLDYCCPTPPVFSDRCRAGPLVKTQYVDLVRRRCPSVYSFAYDDDAGLHFCPADTSFNIVFCP